MLLAYHDPATLVVQTVNYGLTVTTLFVFASWNQEKLEPPQHRMLDPVSVLPQQRFSAAKLKHKTFATGFLSIWNRTNVTDLYQRRCQDL
jgi:hypothetical protein